VAAKWTPLKGLNHSYHSLWWLLQIFSTTELCYLFHPISLLIFCPNPYQHECDFYLWNLQRGPQTEYIYFRTSLNVLPDWASRTAGPNKSSHVKIVVVPISPSAVDTKDHQNIYSLFLRGSGTVGFSCYRRTIKQQQSYDLKKKKCLICYLRFCNFLGFAERWYLKSKIFHCLEGNIYDTVGFTIISLYKESKLLSKDTFRFWSMNLSIILSWGGSLAGLGKVVESWSVNEFPPVN